MNIIPRIGRLGVVVLLLWSCVLHAEWQGRMTQNQAIDIAGMQRMLSQRILKAYCEIGLNESFGDPQDQLNRAVAIFDSNLLQLESFVEPGEIKDALQQVKEVWPAYKDLALKAPTREGARKLMELNRKLLPLAHQVVVQMEKGYGTSAGKWVNIAGRQRMLSQRMAMFYLMHIWGVAAPEDEQAADKATQEYGDAIDVLRTFDRNSDEMKQLIESMSGQYVYIKKAAGEKGDNLSFIVATTSEKMLEYADRLTAYYAGLDKKK